MILTLSLQLNGRKTSPPRDVLGEAERDVLIVVLARAGGNVSRAARMLGIHRQSMQRKMVKHGLRAAVVPA